MAFLTTVKVQPWLETTKMTVAAIDAEVDAWAQERVFGALASGVDTTAWIDVDTTPSAVVQAVAMRYAAAIYRKQYSEDVEEDPAWPVWLENASNATVADILSGALNISTVPTLAHLRPSFWPNDQSSLESPAAFSMGAEF